ncbi:MAG: hypothetical protein SVT52_05705 [Planctomycetota bacterium]|nr:hypothetical protein [Planctomycetota bacterium]
MNISGWQQRLTAELKRDKKKTAIMAALLLVAAVLGIRLVVKSSGPDGANAGAVAMRPQPQAGSQSPTAAALPSERKPASAGRKSSYVPSGSMEITRDIFEANTDVFPPKKQTANNPARLVPSGKPVISEEEVRRRVIQAQAKALTLQSTIHSATPTAIINGCVLCKGEWINGFQVTAINARTCVLEKNGVKIILEMGQ